MPILMAGVFFLTGVFTILSLPLTGDRAQSLRILDVLGAGCLVYLAREALRQRMPPGLWLLVWISGTGLFLVLVGALQDGDTGRLSILVRLVLSVATGIGLARLATDHVQIPALAVGMWCGAVVACLIAYGQLLGVDALMAMAPADRSESAIRGIVRPQAIWGHANAAAQVTMAGAAMILLAWRKRDGVTLVPLLMYAALPLLIYGIMQSRSPLVVGLLVCLVLTARHAQVPLRLAAALCVACLGAFVIFDPESLIGDRWTATFSGLSTAEQAMERLKSTVAGLAIAFEAPLGHALADREARMLAETGIRASHNGFVHAALVIGPWLTGLFLGALTLVASGSASAGSARHYGLAMVSICAMLLFEDAIFEPTITTVLVLIASLALVEGGRSV